MAYLHILHDGNEDLLRELRSIWPTTLLVNRPGRPLENLSVDVDDGISDMTTVGKWALANPDLVQRLKVGASLNEPDRATFYGGDNRGYTDYPTLEQQYMREGARGGGV